MPMIKAKFEQNPGKQCTQNSCQGDYGKTVNNDNPTAKPSRGMSLGIPCQT